MTLALVMGGGGIGPNPLDPARRPAAARAGLAQAVGAVDVLAVVWELRR